jgi:micrococcal nuclease
MGRGRLTWRATAITAGLAVVLASVSIVANAQPATAIPVHVAAVSAGDTVTIRLPDGQWERLRLGGIDSPELRYPTAQDGCYAAEAASRTRAYALDRVALFEPEVEPRDRYGRLLGYLWIDGLNLSVQLAAEGYAVLLTDPPNGRYEDQIRAAVTNARAQGLGLWGACYALQVSAPSELTELPEEVDSALPADTTSPATGGEACDAAYPTVCIPSPPPYLKCSDIPYRRFVVLPPDPHQLDPGRDGIGCEGRR